MNNQIKKHFLVLFVSLLIFSYCSPKKDEPKMTEISKPAIGLQLFTLRDSMDSDPIGTLKKVAELGYTHLELASYDSGRFYGFEPVEFKKITQGLGLNTISIHVPLTAMAENPELVVKSCADAGLKYVIMPWLDEDQRSSIDNFKKHIEVINKIAPMCTAAGMTFAYHNHDFEFIPLEGQIPMELIMAETDPNHVKVELDLYWVSKVGIDPVEYLKSNGGRVVLWHVKDMDDTPEKNFAEVGNGIINYTEIFKLKDETALQYFFIEQDKSDDPFKSIEISIGNVKKLLAN